MKDDGAARSFRCLCCVRRCCSVGERGARGGGAAASQEGAEVRSPVEGEVAAAVAVVMRSELSGSDGADDRIEPSEREGTSICSIRLASDLKRAREARIPAMPSACLGMSRAFAGEWGW